MTATKSETQEAFVPPGARSGSLPRIVHIQLLSRRMRMVQGDVFPFPIVLEEPAELAVPQPLGLPPPVLLPQKPQGDSALLFPRELFFHIRPLRNHKSRPARPFSLRIEGLPKPRLLDLFLSQRPMTDSNRGGQIKILPDRRPGDSKRSRNLPNRYDLRSVLSTLPALSTWESPLGPSMLLSVDECVTREQASIIHIYASGTAGEC